MPPNPLVVTGFSPTERDRRKEELPRLKQKGMSASDIVDKVYWSRSTVYRDLKRPEQSSEPESSGRPPAPSS